MKPVDPETDITTAAQKSRDITLWTFNSSGYSLKEKFKIYIGLKTRLDPISKNNPFGLFLFWKPLLK